MQRTIYMFSSAYPSNVGRRRRSPASMGMQCINEERGIHIILDALTDITLQQHHICRAYLHMITVKQALLCDNCFYNQFVFPHYPKRRRRRELLLYCISARGQDSFLFPSASFTTKNKAIKGL